VDELQATPDPVVQPPDIIGEQPFCESDPSPVLEVIAPAFDWKLFVLLLAASLVGTLALVPFSWTLLKQVQPQVVPESLFPVVMAISVVVELFISAAAIGVGLATGPRVNLALLFVPRWSTGHPSAARRFWVIIGEPLAIGLTLGAIIGAFTWHVDFAGAGRPHTLTMPTAWEGLFASIGAGIREEVWLRLGLMTFLVWLGAVLVRRLSPRNGEPPATVVWIANLLAALIFAAIHLPQAHALLGLSTRILLLVFLGNGLPGLVFGWLYWRRGLVAAMLAHFGLDLVLKVFIPLLS